MHRSLCINDKREKEGNVELNLVEKGIVRERERKGNVLA